VDIPVVGDHLHVCLAVLTLETVWEEYSHHFEGQDSRANIKRWPGEEGDDAGCGRENMSRIDPIDQGSAVVDPSAGLQAE
jgi:hypothetical protein